MDWKDEYSVGILEIDNQHKAMLRSFSIIEETLESAQDRTNTHYAIVELIQLSRVHFLFEEAMMRMFGYPESESHKKCHQHLLIRLDSVERSASNRTSDLEIVKLMRDCLMAHMLGDDKGYAKYILAGAQVVKSCGDSS
ncbi:MAG: bacteriohemerythrin [Sulfuricella sp.]